MKNRKIAISFLVALLLPSLVLLVVLKTEKFIVQKQVEAKIRTDLNLDELIRLKFSYGDVLNQLEWEHSREFRFNGEMYDVVEQCEEKDSVVFWVYHDVKESVINRRIHQLLADELDTDSKQNKKKETVNKWAKKLYCYSVFYQRFTMKYNRNLFYYADDLLEVFIKKNFPPPQLIV